MEDGYKYIVSLGGGCDVALALQFCKIRDEACIFDWLWNLNSGLENVYSIIEDNFVEFLKTDSYYYEKYPIFGKKQVLTHKKYPQLVLLHQNPLDNKNDADALERRAQRFLNILKSKEKVLFIYYRLMDKNEDRTDFSELLTSESTIFAQKLHDLYPELKFDLLSLYMAKDIDKDRFKWVEEVSVSKDCRIFFDSVLLREGEKEEGHAISQEIWIDVLLKYVLKSRLKRFFFREILRCRLKLNQFKSKFKRKKTA